MPNKKISVRPLVVGCLIVQKVPKVNKKSVFYAMKLKWPFHRVNGIRQFTQKWHTPIYPKRSKRNILPDSYYKLEATVTRKASLLCF